VRDRPSFDDLEAPAREASRIDGLTDEEWARRRLRSETRFRIAFGAVFGVVVALLATWHWMLFDARFAQALALVVVGCVVLFATLFARRRDYDALDYAQWIGLPEWKFLEKLPLGLLAAIVAAALALAIALAVIVLGAALSRHL
jgi:MFS superfamily sulfate permease-like transporter